jgi:hypothetical protein
VLQTIITAGDLSNALSYSAGNDGTLLIQTGAAGAKVNAISLDALGNLKSTTLAAPAFSAYQTVAQALAAATDVLLTLDTKEFDTASAFSLATNRFQPSVAGYYQLNGSGQINGTTTYFYVSIYKSGAIMKFGNFVVASSIGPVSNVSALTYLNGTTDYVDFRAQTGTTLSTNFGLARTSFSGFLARSA